MTNIFYSLIFGLFIVAMFTTESRAETFESLTFTPPDGWTKQISPDKTTYQRPGGIGAIIFYPGYPTNISAAEEFRQMWQTRLEPILSVKAPQPQMERDGDLTAAVGGQRVDAQGTITTALMTVFVGRGKAICIVSLSAGDDVLREVTAFFESIRAIRESATTQMKPGSASSGKIAFYYQAPPGLTAKNDGQMIQLAPAKMEFGKCTYLLSPPISSKGTLEADARAAFRSLPVQGTIYEEHLKPIRGITPDGWKYFLFGADIRNSYGQTTNYAMVLAFSGSAGQVNIVIGIGYQGTNCAVNDINFIRLFHSLNPHGWTSDGGKAFNQELRGIWQNTEKQGISRFNFMANGRYDSGYAASTTFGNLETTVSNVGDGSYKLSDNTLTLTPDLRSRNAEKYRIRVYEVYSGGVWKRTMALFTDSMTTEREYYRVVN